MPRTRPRYPREIRQQMIELVRAGWTPHELAQELRLTLKIVYHLGLWFKFILQGEQLA